MSKFKSFETQRLLLKPTLEKDAAFILELLNSPKWLHYIGDRNIKCVEDAENYIREKMLPQLRRLGYSSYTIFRKTDLKKIGSCGLIDRECMKGIDIGYAILPGFEGKGYAFEAAQKLKIAAFQEFGIKTLNAITSKDNFASQKLLEKLGFSLKGVVQLPNEEKELFFYQT